MLEELYKRRMTREEVEIDPHVEQLTVVESEVDGKAVRTTQYKNVCVEDNFKQFVSSDFDFSNIVSTGATHLLKDCQMSNHDAGTFSSQVDFVGRKIDEAIATQNNQSNSNEQ